MLPFLGNLAEMGIGLVSFLIALILSSITIAIAWIIYRPLIGIALLVVAVGSVVVFKKKLPEAKSSEVVQS